MFRASFEPSSGASEFTKSIDLSSNGKGFISLPVSVASITAAAAGGTYFLFDNILTGGKVITYIFRPFGLGDALSATAYVGLSNDFSLAAPTLGIIWRYTTATNVWGLFADNGAVITSVAGSQANVWCKVTISRTGALTFSSSFTIIGGATTTGTGSVASSTALTGLGFYWGNNGTGALGSKYMDIDFIEAEWNSNR